MSELAHGRISRREPLAWAGIGAVTVGVLLHLPMYVRARDDDYMLAGMAVDAPMTAGMFLILAGLAATALGLSCRATAPRSARTRAATLRSRSA